MHNVNNVKEYTMSYARRALTEIHNMVVYNNVNVVITCRGKKVLVVPYPETVQSTVPDVPRKGSKSVTSEVITPPPVQREPTKQETEAEFQASLDAQLKTLLPDEDDDEFPQDPDPEDFE